MSLLTMYLNQQAVFQPYLKDNDNGEPEYGTVKSIRCRKQSGVTMLVSNKGDTIFVHNIYYTNTPVKAGDLLDGTSVEKSFEMTDLNGRVEGYKVLL